MIISYKTRYILPLLIGILSTVDVFSQQNNEIISAIKKEIDRNKAELKIGQYQSPFYISYSLVDLKTLLVESASGSILSSEESHRRLGTPTLLVGDYQKNNKNFFDINIYYQTRYRGRGNLAPIENDAKGIATLIWSDLDLSYKSAIETFETKMAALRQQNQQGSDAGMPDFDQVAPVKKILTPVAANLDKSYWENYTKKASEVTRQYPEILNSNVKIIIRDAVIYTYNTEGSEYAIPSTFYQLVFFVSTQTDDGQELSDMIFYEHSTFEKMPDLKTFTDSCKVLTEELIRLRKAPLVTEAYTGPVLFEKMAVGEAINQLFLENNLIARRQQVENKDGYYGRNFDEAKGNNFEMLMNKKIVSRSLTVKSISGTSSYKGIMLDGYMPLDAEGVVPEKEMMLVENGVLRNLLNGRTPTPKVPHSNGHNRFDFDRFNQRVSPGNIHVTSNNTFSKQDLKAKLIAAAKEEDLEYAYIVRRQRWGNPLFVYKVYVSDGREELVRGAQFTDFNLRTFRRILGTSEEEFFYNTSAFGSLMTGIVPESILFEELDVTKNNNITLKNPYLVPRP